MTVTDAIKHLRKTANHISRLIRKSDLDGATRVYYAGERDALRRAARVFAAKVRRSSTSTRKP